MTLSSNDPVAKYIAASGQVAWNVFLLLKRPYALQKLGLSVPAPWGGISMNFATAGIPVTIVEQKQEALDRGLSVIQKIISAALIGGVLAKKR